MITLTSLRAAAKALRKAALAGDADARARLQKHFPDRADLKHADALHVIAREQGYPSWPQLKLALETAEMSREARAERLKIALYFGQHWVTERLLADDPDLPSHNLGLQIALYDRRSVAAVLTADPGAATRLIGVRSPLLHLAFSQHIHAAPERRDDMLAIAEALLARGADPNDGYPAEPGSEHMLSALYGALGHANNLALAEWLLEHGATPDDNESLYHSTELGQAEGLRLLLKHKATPDGTNALLRALDFDRLDMVEALLEAGASTSSTPGPHPSGQPVPNIPALHQAARRWCSAPVVKALLAHGADPAERWHGATAYAMARIYGNTAMASVLEAAGHGHPLDPLHATLATCASGATPTERLDVAALPEELRQMPCHIAGRLERLAHLQALFLAGFDPHGTDEMDLPPLHIAAWEGVPQIVAYMLTHNPDLTARNAFGGDALDTCVHGAEHCPSRTSPDRDHIACARLLLDAGAVLHPEYIDSTGAEEMAAFLEDHLAGTG